MTTIQNFEDNKRAQADNTHLPNFSFKNADKLPEIASDVFFHSSNKNILF